MPNAFDWPVSVPKTDNSPRNRGSPDVLSERSKFHGGQKTPNFALVSEAPWLTSPEPRSHPFNTTAEETHTRIAYVQLQPGEFDARQVSVTYIAVR